MYKNWVFGPKTLFGKIPFEHPLCFAGASLTPQTESFNGFDGYGPLVKRCNGFDGSLWSSIVSEGQQKTFVLDSVQSLQILYIYISRYLSNIICISLEPIEQILLRGGLRNVRRQWQRLHSRLNQGPFHRKSP